MMFVGCTDVDGASLVPYVNQSLVPGTAPGGQEFTLMVNATGFVSGSTVNWNGRAWVTILSTDIAKAERASVMPGPQSPPTGDFNGDSRFDLAGEDNGSSTVSVLPGGRTFHGDMDYATGGTFSCVVARDLNRDGKLDLDIQNQDCDTISVFFGNGHGILQLAGDLAVAASLGQTNGPTVSLFPARLTFDSQTVGTKSATQEVTLTSTGSAPLVISDILDENNADFAIEQGCGPEGSSLAPGASCLISVTFTPTQNGTRFGTVKFIDNASNSPQIVSLRGTGVETSPVVELEPRDPISFAPQKVGTTSTAKTVQLTNLGTVTLSISSFVISGDFAQTNNCPANLNPAAGCSIAITFKPTATGKRTGSVAITDNTPGSPQLIKLNGTGN
jgi:hypothetical protein